MDSEQEFDTLYARAADGEPVDLEDVKAAVEWIYYKGIDAYPGTRCQFWVDQIRTLLEAVQT